MHQVEFAVYPTMVCETVLGRRSMPIVPRDDQTGEMLMSNTPSTSAATITEHEAQQVQRANVTGRQPVVFVHGLWLLPSSWARVTCICWQIVSAI